MSEPIDPKGDFKKLVDNYRIVCYDFKEACRSNEARAQDYYSALMEKKKIALLSAYEAKGGRKKNMRGLILRIVYDARFRAEEKVDQIMAIVGGENEV